ncbi:sporulation-delaying protein SdpB family protein [Microbacterium sp.]|uniref:sporulation-delaying protein SdpB family protein n=1 Tax=Microbacterium sp. TaxID=51671 RepID=UPI0025E686E4|nr:sporulation-delaying protein SdpB family protein [Microbacterium sp.]MBT9607824.1 HTTM domain-containing protein [Microbacterium sp.]
MTFATRTAQTRAAIDAALMAPLRSIPAAVAVAERGIREITPFTPVLGAARSLLALATLLTIVATPHGQLFFRSVNYPDGVTCDRPFSAISLFCVWRGDTGGIAVAVAVIVLLAVVSGILPAVTAVPHWWVAWSFNMSSPIPDGGDQVSAVLTLLLIPILLVDRRRHHWQIDRGYASRAPVAKVMAYTSLVLCAIQVCVIYFHAAVGKFPVEEWANGTVLWYWFQDPTFAPAEPLRTLMLWVAGSAAGGAVLTYGSLLIELLLAFALVAGPRYRAVMLVIGSLFHLGIAVCFGLWSFSATMVAALLLYLARPSRAAVATAATASPIPQPVGAPEAAPDSDMLPSR